MNVNALSNSIRSIANTAMSMCQKHAPEILTGLGIAGAVSSTVLAVKATPKALEDIKYAKIDKVLADNDQLSPEEAESKAADASLTPVETVKTCWKYYIPAAVSGAASIACIIGGQHISMRRNAAIAGAYALSEATLKDYKDKVKDVVGEKKTTEIHDAIAQDKLADSPVPDSLNVTGDGKTLCFDPYSGRYFRSDMETLRRRVNDANYYLMQNQRMLLNDWYDFIDLEATKIGWDMAWKVDEGLLEFKPSSLIAPNGEPCIVVDFINGPVFDTDMYY